MPILRAARAYTHTHTHTQVHKMSLIAPIVLNQIRQQQKQQQGLQINWAMYERETIGTNILLCIRVYMWYACMYLMFACVCVCVTMLMMMWSACWTNSNGNILFDINTLQSIGWQVFLYSSMLLTSQLKGRLEPSRLFDQSSNIYVLARYIVQSGRCG